MQIPIYSEYSEFLKRNMEFKVYGHDGPLALVIPTQNNRFHEWEFHQMYEQVQDYIDQGKIRFVACDAIDLETWSNTFADPMERVAKHEKWITYLIHELIPSVKQKCEYEDQLFVMGASLGATHAANIFFRFPDEFKGVLGLSGIYDVDEYYGHQGNDISYLNNPLAYLPNMELDHPFIQKYNEKQIIFLLRARQLGRSHQSRFTSSSECSTRKEYLCLD